MPLLYLIPAFISLPTYKSNTSFKTKNKRRNHPKVEPPPKKNHYLQTSGTGFTAIYLFTSSELSLDYFSWDSWIPKLRTVYPHKIPNTARMNFRTTRLEIWLDWTNSSEVSNTLTKKNKLLFPIFPLSSINFPIPSAFSFIFFFYFKYQARTTELELTKKKNVEKHLANSN